uniref:Pleckstrin homology domain containing, family B (evectins) member 2 n=1 Tax=Cyprinus carpio TaxID=7962 RepID=A0A8C1M5A5_CYPCA
NVFLKSNLRNWFDLWSDGRLVFYDDQQRRDMEDEIHMKVDCINIRNASACRDLMPPEGKSKDSLLQIVCRDGRVISICADSADDALAWTMALQDARLNTVSYTNDSVALAPPPYSELNPTPQVIYLKENECIKITTEKKKKFYVDIQLILIDICYLFPLGGYAPGVNHVIVQERRRDDTGDVALGMLAGAATGLALGSLFSVF